MTGLLTALVIVLVVTNVVAFSVLATQRQRPAEVDAPVDPDIDAALAAAERPAAPGRGRRIISIEILNPIELAGARHRMFGIAGSIAPRITRRVVYEQTVKILRQQLEVHRVIADVRVHTMRPVRIDERAGALHRRGRGGVDRTAGPVGLMKLSRCSTDRRPRGLRRESRYPGGRRPRSSCTAARRGCG